MKTSLDYAIDRAIASLALWWSRRPIVIHWWDRAVEKIADDRGKGHPIISRVERHLCTTIILETTMPPFCGEPGQARDGPIQWWTCWWNSFIPMLIAIGQRTASSCIQRRGSPSNCIRKLWGRRRSARRVLQDPLPGRKAVFFISSVFSTSKSKPPYIQHGLTKTGLESLLKLLNGVVSDRVSNSN